MPPSQRLVFVYGTLKRGFPNSVHMPSRATFLFPATTSQAYPLVVGAGRNRIPFLLDRPGSGRPVRGEVYAVDDDTLRLLDDFEGTGWGFYKRREIEVVPESTDEKQEAQDTAMAGAYFRGGGGGRWHEDELAQLEHLAEYTPALAQGYLPRDHPDADRAGLMTREQ